MLIRQISKNKKPKINEERFGRVHENAAASYLGSDKVPLKRINSDLGKETKTSIPTTEREDVADTVEVMTTKMLPFFIHITFSCRRLY